MANIPAVFMSGPRLKLVFDGVVIAHCVGFNINVRKRAQHIHTLGEFGPLSVQTMLFGGVDGQLQILKLNPFLDTLLANGASLADQRPDAITALSSDPSTPHIKAPDQLKIENSVLNATENLKSMFDPAKILLTSTFDIEVYQAYPKSDGTIVDLIHLVIENVRLNSRATSMSIGQLVNETVGFEGMLAKVYSPNGLTGGNTDKVMESNTVIDATV